MIPPDLVVPPPYNPEMTSHQPAVVPRPPDSKLSPRSGNNQQITQVGHMIRNLVVNQVSYL